MKKKVLVIGGTGAMGRYVCPKLFECGYEVDALTADVRASNGNIKYITANALDDEVIAGIVKRGYDAIIDFMWYTADDFAKRMNTLLNNTSHYFSMSSYRVFADSKGEPLTEQSPRLYEVLRDEEFFTYENYAHSKCSIEDMLKASEYSNWTVLRPTIVYSVQRYPLVAFAGTTIVDRALAGKKVVVPEETLKKKTTMVWAGDVAKMIAGLIFNPVAMREIYNVGTSEWVLWQDVVDFYEREFGLQVVGIPLAEYTENFQYGNFGRLDMKWIIDYDRMYDRVIDNSKVLRDAGLSANDIMGIFDGLHLVLREYLERETLDRKLDEYLEKHGK